MNLIGRTSLAAALLLASTSFAHAQVPVDPSGHWEGAIQMPSGELQVEVDIARNTSGALAGAMNQPAEQIKGLPLAAIAVDRRSIRFHARSDQTFAAALSADGQSMSGGFHISIYSIPFSLKRMGEAMLVEPVKSAAIGKELEGTWNAVIAQNGVSRRVALTMANQADGTAAGRLVNIDDGELQIPLAITQNASSVTLVATVLPGSFSGVLNADGTELDGAWTQGPLVLPVTFRRAAASGK